MSLNAKLQEIKAASRSRLPAETAACMARATEQLKESGLAAMDLAPGRPAPAFALDDCRGTRYNSPELLARGPLILTFYRGSW